jgi:D-xylose transport system ATP-binding protein
VEEDLPMTATVQEPSPAATGTPVLSLSGINKRFGAVRALSDVQFEVRLGEVVALVGDNGAGKSTLVKVVAGVAPADDGEIRFDGQSVTIPTPHAAQDLGIATVFQDLALCDNLDVVANLYLGREVLSGGLMNEVEMERRSLELLRQVAAKIPSVRTRVASLSGGQRQVVAISRSLLGEPKVVILDEPTAALGVAQTAEVLNLVERLRERGLAIVLISHNLADVFAVADRIVVLRLGRNGGEFTVGEVDQEDVVAAITGAKDNVVAERAARRAHVARDSEDEGTEDEGTEDRS